MEVREVVDLYTKLLKYKKECDTDDDIDAMEVIDKLDSVITILADDIVYRIEQR